MLELEKEYTYSQICETLGWKQKAGNSKKAQINELESAFEWYHPINKKTHKEKKSYIFTKQLRELVEPSKSNCGGSRNLKNIKPMVEYMQGLLSDYCFGEYISMTDWYCDHLKLLDKELCKTVYCGDDAIDAYCNKYSISNERLLCDYVSTAKSILKDIFVKSLKYMEKNNMAMFEDGNIFIYKLGKRTLGYVATDMLNDVIKENETVICDELKEEYALSDKLKGRQLLLQIYADKNLTDQFNELKLSILMDNDEALEILNEELEVQHEHYHKDCGSICSERPLIAYYRGICIEDMELVDADTDVLANQISNIIRTKTRKSLLNKHYTNKWTGEIIYTYNEIVNGSDFLLIEKCLFKYFDEQFDFLNSEPKLSDNADQWGELIDFSIEEILEMPAISEVPDSARQVSDTPNSACQIGELQSDLTPKEKLPWVTDKSESFGIADSDRPEMDSQKFVRPNSNSVQMDANEKLSQNSSKAIDDIELIDIESLFDDEIA